MIKRFKKFYLNFILFPFDKILKFVSTKLIKLSKNKLND